MYKMNKEKYFFTIILLILSFCGWTQNSDKPTNSPNTKEVKYQSGFKFNDGLFLDFEQVKNNKAIPFKYIVGQNIIDKRSVKNYLKKQKSIRLFHDNKVIEIAIKDIWGYASNGILHIQSNDDFYRIPGLGKIAIFVAEVNVEHIDYNNSFGYGYDYGYFPESRRTYTSRELKKFLLDFETGEINEYSIHHLTALLSRDKTILDAFLTLSKSKQKQYAYRYIREFNQKHPIFFRE